MTSSSANESLPGVHLETHLEMPSVLSSATSVLVSAEAEQLGAAVDDVIAQVGTWLGMDRVHVYEVDGDSFRLTNEWCADGVTRWIDELQDVQLADGRAWLSGFGGAEVMRVADAHDIPDERRAERERLLEYGVRSLAAVAMQPRGELAGFVAFVSCHEPRDFGPVETSMLVALSEVIGASIVRRDANRALAEAERRAVEALRVQSLTDALTGLPNRLLLLDRIRQSSARVQRNGGINAVVMLDLDGFRLVNDSRGHDVGDDLLCRVADRLRQTMRAHDTCARFGGDEFVLLLDDVEDVDDVLAFVERVRSLLVEPFVVGDAEHRLTGSFGVRTSDGPAEPESLLREAEIAMHEAKQTGRNRVVVFDDRMREQAVRRMILAGRLRRAIDHDLITVLYQPLVDTATGRVVGAEALARWEDPQLGPVAPIEFIPLAEETGLVAALGERVLAKACRAAATWPDHLTVAVNIARQQLVDPLLPVVVLETCEAARLPPYRLELEVTESSVMTDVPATVATLAQLRGAGVKVAIDDFGTGHSSLALLRDLPADRLKIDRSFVDRIVEDDRDLRLVRAVCGVAEDFRLEVLAEGVETTDQQRVLVDLGVPTAQGWLFGRPMTAEALRGLVEGRMAA